MFTFCKRNICFDDIFGICFDIPIIVHGFMEIHCIIIVL